MQVTRNSWSFIRRLTYDARRLAYVARRLTYVCVLSGQPCAQQPCSLSFSGTESTHVAVIVNQQREKSQRFQYVSDCK